MGEPPLEEAAGEPAPAALPAPSDWQNTVFSRIAAGEYAIRAPDGVLAAFNREQGLRASFGRDGVFVRERAPAAGTNVSSPPEKSGLRLTVVAMARSDERTDLDAAAFVEGACRKDGALDEMGQCLRRVEASHDGLVEWWENTPLGLEQGFDVAERPHGTGPLRLEIQVDGAASRIDDGGQSATFTLPGGLTVHYGKLLAEDATKRALPIRLVPGPSGLAIEVDDSRAVYPILIDPMLETNLYVSGTAQASSEFGRCVASAGDVNGDGYGDVLVGAPLHDGAHVDGGKAYLFLGKRVDRLATTPIWTAEGVSQGDRFGCPAKGAGDVNGDGYGDIAIAAPFNDGAFSNQGAVYVYHGAQLPPAATPSATLMGQSADAQLGSQIVAAGDVDRDGDGDLAVVSSTGYGVYAGTPGGSVLLTPLKTRSGHPGWLSAGDVDGDGYGDIVGVVSTPFINGTTFTVNRGGPGGVGAVTTDVVSAWLQDAEVVGDTNGDGRADLVVSRIVAQPVGSQVYFSGGFAIHHGTAGGLSMTPTFTEHVPSAHDIAPAGDVNGDGLADFLALGIPTTGLSGTTEWSFTVCTGTPTGLGVQTPHPLGPGPAGQFTLGPAGDVNGDGYADALLGMPTYDLAQPDQGRVRLYMGAPAGIGGSLFDSPTVTAPAGSHLGSHVAGVGDLNGDGYGDIAVGAADYQGKGAAWVFGGQAGGLTSSAVWSVVSQASGDGIGVAAAGDVNGDGYADLLVSKPGWGGNDFGRAQVHLGASSGWLQTSPVWTVTGTQNGEQVGESIASAGDVNGDGFADVAVGASNHDSGGLTNNGKVTVYRGAATPTSTVLWQRTGTCQGGRFGYAVASGNDVNGDTLDDLVVGSPLCGGGQVDVFGGSTTTPLAATIMQKALAQADARFGQALAGVGDVNGDGYADVLVGAHLYDGAGASMGRLSLHYGGPSPLPDWVVVGAQTGARLGTSVAAAGDVNGDGLGDFIAGAPLHDVGASTDQGRAFVYHGASGGPAVTPTWTSPSLSVQAGAEIGAAVSGAGDINGDGYSDILIGAPNYDDGAVDNGEVWFLYGNAPSAAPADVGMRVQTRRLGTTTPIAPRGKTASTGGFDIAVLRAKNPAGRSPVKLEYEVKWHGAGYIGLPLQTTPYVDSMLTGVTVQGAAPAGLGYGGFPHYRVRTAYSPVVSPPWSRHSPWRDGGVVGNSLGVAVRLLP